jgi:Ca2+-binding EF-hand superfamily protein
MSNEQIIAILKEGLKKKTESSLSKEDIAFLKKVTDMSEEEINAAFKDFAKQSGSAGLLDKQQFANLYLKLTGLSPGESTKKIDLVFEQLDQNNDNGLSFQEFLIWFSLRTKAEPSERFKYSLSLFDLNEDGFLTSDEIKKVLSGLLIFMDAGYGIDEVTANCMKKLDTDKNGKVTESEFIQCLLSDPKMQSIMAII